MLILARVVLTIFAILILIGLYESIRMINEEFSGKKNKNK